MPSWKHISWKGEILQHDQQFGHVRLFVHFDFEESVANSRNSKCRVEQPAIKPLVRHCGFALLMAI